MTFTANGNGHATLKVERGASLAQRKLTKSQRAALAADVFDGRTVYQPTRRQLSLIFGVSEVYVDFARALPPERRQEVLEGRAGLSHLKPPAHRLRNGKSIDDATLVDVVRSVGTEKVLAIACAVEREQIHH